MRRGIWGVAAVMLIACGDDTTTVPDGGNGGTGADDDPASSVPCTGMLGFPSVPSLHDGGGSRIAIADVNGDGRADVIVGRYGTLYVYTRGADGSYGAAIEYPIQDNTYARIRVRDFEGDGDLDVLVEGQNDQDVFWNAGDGTFTKTTTWQSGASDLGDVDGDGKLDLISDYGSLTFWRNTGTGFTNPTSSSTNVVGVHELVVADLNGDNRADVVRSTSSAIYVSFNTGSGYFAAATEYSAGEIDRDSQLALADTNNDGKLDVVVATHPPGSPYYLFSLTVLLNNGDGTFGTRIDSPLVSGFSFPSLALADINGDGNTDAVLADFDVVVALGTGTGQFTAPQRLPVAAMAVAVGDLDGDSRIDVVATKQIGSASLLMNDGTDRLFARRVVFQRGGGSYDETWAVRLADTDDDSKPELLSIENEVLAIRDQSPDGPLASMSTDYTPSHPPRAMAVFDANNDGTLDALLTAGFDGDLLTNNAGVFTSTPLVIPAFALRYFVTADIDHDGDIDLAAGGERNLSFRSVYVLINRGDGTFEPRPIASAGIDTYGLTLGDVDGDGHIDVIVSGTVDSYDKGIYVHRGVGDGTFLPPARHAVAHGWFGPIFLRDLDGDGARELVHVHHDGIEVLRIDGFGAVTELSYQPGGGGVEAALADFNGDQKLDVVAVATYSDVAVSLGNGDGTFGVARFYEGYGRSVAVGDADGDGRVDIATGASKGETSVMYGHCLP